jgi:tetratricopeptide (TPR) repeat protein
VLEVVLGAIAGRDLFVSYTAANEAWARWIAVELERAGWTTVSQVLDIRPGHDFLHAMHDAISTTRRTVAVLSPSYLSSRFGGAEWRAAFADDPSGAEGLLIPVRVQPCELTGLLRGRVVVDLFDADEETARSRLLHAVSSPGNRPTTAPFPGRRVVTARESALRFPGDGPEISNLPARNRTFVGRTAVLDELHARLQSDATAAVLPIEAVHGLGGVGKTELALAFAHTYSSDYDITWLVPSEHPTTAASHLAGLAHRLGLPSGLDQNERITELLEVLRTRDRWLLIYDNAEHPSQLEDLLPRGGHGNVLVTSRWSAWSRWAHPLRLDVLAPEESVEFLTRRTRIDDPSGHLRLADLLGHLPLALEEAGAFLEETNIAVPDYVALVRDRTRELFGPIPPTLESTDGTGLTGGAEADRRRVAAVWSVSLDRVKSQAPAAEKLLTLCALLGSEIPRSLLPEHADALPLDLAQVVRDPLAYNTTLGSVARYSLAAVSSTALGLHRLVQAVIRARLDPVEEQAWAEAAITLLRAAFPGNTERIELWHDCERILPHLLAAAEHAERLGVAGEPTGQLFELASSYLRDRGQFRQALPLAQRGLAVTAAALGPDHLETAARRQELGIVLWGLGDPRAAHIEVRGALESGERALGPDHPAIGARRNALGLVLKSLGEFTAARTEFERAIAIGEASNGPDHPSTAARRNNLAITLRNLGDPTAARTEFERAIAIGEASNGPDHPENATRRNNLAITLRELGDLTGAREQYLLALRIAEAALGSNHPTVGLIKNNLASALRSLGELSGARTEAEQALTTTETILGPDHPQIAAIRGNLARILHDQGDFDGAQAMYEHAIRISEATLGPDHPTMGTRRTHLARLLQDRGRRVEARTEYERALAISEPALGVDHPRTVGIRQALKDLDTGPSEPMSENDLPRRPSRRHPPPLDQSSPES